MFKQHDHQQTGKVRVGAFREALKVSNSRLSESEIYELLRRLDKDVSGMINYTTFLNEMIKPNKYD
jgi:Ca2+-binding EF-hand superfamily protein